MSSNHHPFTWRHYERILDKAREAGFRFAAFTEEPAAPGRRLYLRHDIDNDIGIAHTMARLEHERQVRATYLVLLRSANYNAAEGRNLRMLGEMADMGHEIGLHFSLIDHPEGDCAHDLPALIRRDAALFESLLGRQVAVFGFHNPTDGGQYKIEVPGLLNTYSAEFFEQAYYLSESNMRWAKGCPCETLASCGAERVQLLVHPLSFAADLASDRDVLVHFLHLKLADLLQYNVAQNGTLRQQRIGPEDLLRYLKHGGAGQ